MGGGKATLMASSVEDDSEGESAEFGTTPIGETPAPHDAGGDADFDMSVLY